MMLTEQPVGRRRAKAAVRASRGFRDECRGLLVTTDVGVSYTHLRTDMQILVFPHADAPVLACVCVRERAAAKQSRLSVARGLWRQICLNAFIVSGEGRDAEREMWHRAKERCGLPQRTDVVAGAGPSLVGLMQSCRRAEEDRGSYQLIQDSTHTCQGKVKLQLQARGRDKA